MNIQKTATAVAFVKKGTGLIKVNGAPISLLQPEILRLKTYEPMLLLGNDKFANVSHYETITIFGIYSFDLNDFRIIIESKLGSEILICHLRWTLE